jgi:cobalt-zinc-cadmium efflux system membrane fusion protein
MKNILLIISILFITACNTESKKQEHEVSKSLELTDKQLETMDVTLDKIKMQTIQPIVYATGKLDLVPNSKAIVSSNIEGKVEKILVVEGGFVEKGDPLLIVNSMELIELQQNYLTARNEAALLSNEYERQKQLRSRNIGSLAEFQTTETKYLIAKNTEESIGEKLKLLGVGLAQLQNKENSNVINQLNITAPITGYVFKLHAILGMSVDSKTEMVEIINLTKFHADIDVYEKDIDLIHEGQKVEIEFINQSIPKAEGVITYILKSIDPETRAVPVHVNFYPPKNTIVLPEMAVKVKITGKAGNELKPTIPLSALLQQGELFYIYYAIKNGDKYQFKKIKVSVGENDGNFTEITYSETLPKEALIVYQNAYMVDAEAKKKGR